MVDSPLLPLRLFDSFQAVRPQRDELLEYYRRNFSTRHVPKSQALRELTVDVIVSPGALSEATCVPFEIPLARACEKCQGTGRTGYFHCDGCDGGGLLWGSARVDVIVPRHAREGAVIPVSLAHLGVQNLYLRVRVHLADA